MQTKQPQNKMLDLAEKILLIADEIEGEVDYIQHFKNWKPANQIEEVEQTLLDLAVELKIMGEELLVQADKKVARRKTGKNQKLNSKL